MIELPGPRRGFIADLIGDAARRIPRFVLPPHKSSPSAHRGYSRIEYALPPMTSPGFLDAVSAVALAKAAQAPWTLVRLPSESWDIVAVRPSVWMRAVTWWKNRERRKQLAEHARRFAHHFAPAQVEARVRATQ